MVNWMSRKINVVISYPKTNIIQIMLVKGSKAYSYDSYDSYDYSGRGL